MVKGRIIKFFWIALAFLAFVSISSAIATSNIYTSTFVGSEIIPITANQLKPSQCNMLNLTNIVTGSGNIQGTNQSDLVLGSSSADRINAKKGNDCVVSGVGNDELRGGKGDDVLMGGSGDDELKGENDVDICYGGDGIDTTDGTCETVYEVP